MVIAIDIGNSTTSIGVFGDNHLIKANKIPNNELIDIKLYLPKANVEAVRIASVVPQKDEFLKRVLQGLYKVEPKFISSSLIKGAYQGLGGDRIANLIGGSTLFGLPVCVIDFGTATTLDVLLKNGEYGGGIILPGVNLCLKSLHKNTAMLPEVSIRRMPPILGNSTEECIEAGAYWGEIYRIKGFVEKIKLWCQELTHETPNNPKFVCTGGVGELFAQGLGLKYEPWLTLWGLYFALL